MCPNAKGVRLAVVDHNEYTYYTLTGPGPIFFLKNYLNMIAFYPPYSRYDSRAVSHGPLVSSIVHPHNTH